MFDLAWPWALLLLPLPLAVYYGLPATTPYHSQALRLPFFHVIATKPSSQVASAKGHPIGLWLIWCLLIFAVSGPRWVGEPQPVQQEGRNIMLALDLSGSMQLADILVNNTPRTRLFVVKQAARQFIEKRLGDRIGLILFGTQAYLQTPLTFDRKTVLHMLNDATVGLAGQTTSIGDAIALAVKRLRKTPPKSRVLILLTDGVNNSGNIEPIQAATIAKNDHIKIYTIGLGASQMVVPSAFGPQLYNPSQDLDEASLKEIAALTGGQYFRAHDLDQLNAIYNTINALEPVKSANHVYRPIKEYYYIPLLMAFLGYLCLGLWPFLKVFPLTDARRSEHG